MWTIGRRQQQLLDVLIEEKLGIPVRVLMEYAGLAVAREAERLLAAAPARLPVRIVCGHGQNAGDALVAARLLLAGGADVTCYLDGSPAGTPEFAANRRTAEALGIPCRTFADLAPEPALVIDGVFGTGFQAGRLLTAETAACFRRLAEIRAAGGCILAIDVPSGLDADTSAYADGAVKADVTVTFLYPKTGLVSDPGRDLAGEIRIDGLGLPVDTLAALLRLAEPSGGLPEWVEPAQVQALAPPRPRRMHKNQAGRMLLVAGSPSYGGAALLAAEAALRSGGGLLDLLTDRSLVAPVLARIPEAMLTSLQGPEDPEAESHLARQLAKGPQAAAIGPGVVPGPQSATLVARLIAQAPKLVLDAGALAVIAADRARFVPLLLARSASPDRQPAILTPHTGEFRRLFPGGDLLPRHDAAAELACALGSVIVLKGAATVIADPRGRILINGTGNPGMARGGSGDVLTGLLLGLLAQGLNALDAAVCAVHLHGSAGDLAACTGTVRTMLPSDVIRFLPDAFRLAGWSGGTESPQHSLAEVP